LPKILVIFKEFENKVIIITGATSGIGLAASKAFLANNAKVVLAGRNILSRQNELDLSHFSTNLYLLINADVSIEADCKNVINQTILHFGKIDVLINNAGVSMRALFADVDIKVLKEIMDINFWGMVYCTKYALPHIMNSKGSIVGISSVAGHKGLPARTGYAASKFAMNGFLETLRIELLKTKVHVMIFSPGYTASNIRKTALNSFGKAQGESPLKESTLMKPEEVATHLLKAIIKRKRNVVLTLIGKATVYLNKIFPNFVDRQVYKALAKEPDSALK
jgi:dehydrogenase/reductase SDR family protein 7B